MVWRGVAWYDVGIGDGVGGGGSRRPKIDEGATGGGKGVVFLLARTILCVVCARVCCAPCHLYNMMTRNCLVFMYVRAFAYRQHMSKRGGEGCRQMM